MSAPYLISGAFLGFSSPALAQDAGWNTEAAALANEPEPARRSTPPATLDAVRGASVVVDMELRAGVAWSTLSEEGRPLDDFVSSCTDLSLGLGTFVSPYLKLGYEATTGARHVLGGREPHEQRGYSQPDAPIEGNTWYFLPVGGYLEIYPSATAGFSIGLRGGVGTFWPPEYMLGGNIELAGMAAVDLGYDHAGSRAWAWGLRLSYAATGFGQYYIDEDYTTTQNSNELTLSARVSLF